MRCGIYVRVSTDDQRDNGYSIDSQLRIIKEYCEKNDYDIVDVYNDAGHSGKDLMRPEMQRLLKDIKSKKIDKLIAIKVDRLTRNNYDGFWLLNYCEERDVKIELILEPYDVSTANGERIGKYGILRLHFISQNKQALYETLLMTNKLTHHLLLVSDSCENYYKELMESYIKNDERLSEKSKELNPLEWTRLMNNYKNTAEEIVLNEYVFI